MNNMTIRSDNALTVEEVRSNVNLAQSIYRQIMKKDVHYGIIPFTDNPTLYKAGSELLLSTFKIAVKPDVSVIDDGDHVTYRVCATGIHIPTDKVIGYGIGECSTAEEKYAWRGASCDQEYEDTAPERRRVKWYKGKRGSNPYSVKQVRSNPKDLCNTVLKMAKKRAQIDLTLTSTAASDIFTQDMEELPEEYLATLSDEEKKAVQEEAKKLPDYPEEKIDQYLKSWRNVVYSDTNKTTLPSLIRKIKSTYTLTEAQEKRIREELKPQEADANDNS